MTWIATICALLGIASARDLTRTEIDNNFSSVVEKRSNNYQDKSFCENAFRDMLSIWDDFKKLSENGTKDLNEEQKVQIKYRLNQCRIDYTTPSNLKNSELKEEEQTAFSADILGFIDILNQRMDNGEFRDPTIERAPEVVQRQDATADSVTQALTTNTTDAEAAPGVLPAP